MKNLLVLVTVMLMASTASAGIIDVVFDGVGDMGHTGTFEDPLNGGETIGVKIVLNNNPYAGYPSYDGYVIDIMEVELKSTYGTLGIVQNTSGKNPLDDIGVNEDWDLKDYTINGPDSIGLSYAALNPIRASNGQPVDLIWNLLYTNSTGYPLYAGQDYNYKIVDLKLDGLVHVGDDYWPGADGPGANGNAWYSAVEDDLGDLVITPEPVTIMLWGVGGLFIRKRK